MSKKSPAGPPQSGGGLSRFFGAPKLASATPTKSFFDDDNFDDFKSASTSSPAKPVFATPSKSPIPNLSTTTPVKSSTTASEAPTALSASPVPPSSAIKHPRQPIVESDDDEIIIKKKTTSTTTPIQNSSTSSSSSVKRSKYEASSSEEDDDSTDSSSGHSSGSSDDSDNDEDDDGSSGDESFVSESEDEKPKKRAVGHKTPTISTPKGKKGTSPRRVAPGSTSVTASTSEDESATETMNCEPQQRPQQSHINTNGGLTFASFINTGAPATSTTTTTSSSKSSPAKSKTPLLSNANNSIINYFDQQRDDDDDDDQSSSNNKSTSKGSTTTNASPNQPNLNSMDYQLPDFVQPDKIRDKLRRRPDHPEYDARTLYIPADAMKSFTGAQRQFWEMKSENMDVVLLFKVGKFYELFDLDAEVGVKELALSRMGNGDRLHVGFPEAGYAKYATILVKRGYKVACGEQIQTPDQMKEVNAKLPRGAPKQTVVDREICSLVTPGTGVLDEFLTTSFNTYLLSIMEFQIHKSQSQVVNDSGDVTFNRVDYRDKDVIYGVCFVDTSTGAFQIGSFVDNTNKSSFKALLAQVNPAELLYFKDSLSTATETILRGDISPNCIRTGIPKNEKLDSTRCISHLAGLGYFKPPPTGSMNQTNTDDTVTLSKISPELKTRVKITLANINQVSGWPNVLQTYRDKVTELDQVGDDLDEQEFQERFQLNETFWGAFGLILMYLKRTLIDKELIPLCKFKQYIPIESAPKQLLTNQQIMAQQKQLELFEHQQHQLNSQNALDEVPSPHIIQLPEVSYESDAEHLILDAQTLANLEILINGEGALPGTLLSYIDHCSTSFGKRLLHKWLIRPLFCATDINNRLDAVSELIDHYDIIQTSAKKLSKIPDLERMLARIRANGIKKDVQAIMYGDVGKVQVELFLKCLDGFEVALAAVNEFLGNKSGYVWDSELLKSLSFVIPPQNANGDFLDEENPNIFALVQQLLIEFRDSFDSKQAQKDGYITPREGVVDEFDDAKHAVQVAEQLLNQQLATERAKFGNSQNIIWCHKNKETYQLEIPVEVIDRYPKGVDATYEQASSTTKVRRFYTPTIRALAKRCDEAKARKDEVLKDVTRQVFEKFSLDYSVWSGVIDSLASLDCLFSLATASYVQHSGIRTVRPVVLEVDQTHAKKPFLELRNAIHPTVAKNATFAQYTGAPQSYIPNDTDLGTDTNPSHFILVSGPNMGGKSSLLRQVCCSIILAQIGCFVPAESMRFTPIDRIFTRVGANDRIMQGQSTFLVELEETSHILRHATSRSFVILDELGRGTSTFDGTAIAYSVIQYLSQIVQCMTLFSTHYHMLLQEYRNNPLISMYHMACKVHNGNDQASGTADHNKHVQRITFLYKFVPGTCNQSFGLHVAALAKLPALVIDRAYEKGEWFSICFEQPDNEPTKLLKRIIIALHHNDFFTLKKLRQQFTQLQLKQQ